jgi:hypothetical protein
LTQNPFRIRSRQDILADLELKIEIFYQNYGTKFDKLIKRKKIYYQFLTELALADHKIYPTALTKTI